jgi:ABC-2 type transport system permease protein
LLANCGYKLVETIILLTVAYSLSILLGNSSAAIVITLVLSVSGGPLGFFAERYQWLKYYLFLHTDLSGYAAGLPPVPGITMLTSVMIIVIHLVVFLFFSWFLFQKRDLASK